MAARTSWNPRSDRAPDYLDDDAYDPAYDDLLNQGFDDYGRLTRRGPRGHDDLYEPRGGDDLRRAVQSLARQVEAAAQSSRPRLPAPPAGRGGSGRVSHGTLDALDRLEARLDSLNEEAQRRGGDTSQQAEFARVLQGHNEAERAKVEAKMERHFKILDERIGALHDLARGQNVDEIRDDLATIGARMESLATNGHSVSGSIDQMHDQLGELRHRLESEGWNGTGALSAMQDRLDLITDKLAQLELTPSALSAVERGYSHILERVSRIEQLAGQNVVADDLWDRLDGFGDQIGAMQSNDGLAALEARIAGLSDNIEALAANRGHDPAIDRLDMKIADIARTIGVVRDRRDTNSGAIEARLADITARIDKIGQDRGRVDFTPVERQISTLSSRVEHFGSRQPEVDLSGLERQFTDLGSRIEQMLDRPAPVAEDRPDFDNIEARLGELQSRLEDVYALAEKPAVTQEPSEALAGVDSRLAALHSRLDDLTLSTVSDPADLTPINSRLNTIDEQLGALAEKATSSELTISLAAVSDKINVIDEQLRSLASSSPDLTDLRQRLDAIDRQIENVGSSGQPVDLAPLTSQLNALDQHLRGQKPATEIDLQAVIGRFDAIESRLETLVTGLPADTSLLAERLDAIDRRFDDLPTGNAPDFSPLNKQLAAIDEQLRGFTGSPSGDTLDWSPIADRFDALERRFSDRQPGDQTDFGGLKDTLSAIEERISGLAAGSSETTDISPVTERLQAIEQRLDDMRAAAAGAAVDNDQLVPLLETFETSLRKMSTSDDIAALADKVNGLHQALDSAGDGSALDDMADLRKDITYLRRELRSMPMMAGADEESGGMAAILNDIRDRLDRIPDAAGMSEGSHEGSAAIAAMAASIENSIDGLRNATAVSDEDTRRTLDALNTTMEAIVGRMAYLEGGAAPVPATDMPAGIAEAMPAEFPEPPEYHQPAADLSETIDIPEISIGVQPEAAETHVETAEAPDPVADSVNYALPGDLETQVSPDYQDGTADDNDSPFPVYDTAVPDAAPEAPDEPAFEPAFETAAEQPVEQPADQPADQPAEQPAEPAYDTPASEAPDVGYAVDAAEEPAGGQPFEGEADTASGQPPDLDAGSRSILGRLTSSQILKRATGGRADSFTPESDETSDQSPDTLLEPGTDTPMDSALRGAPSSDTALLSGDAAAQENRTRQGAGLGALAAASGLGFDTAEKEDPGNQFLSAARRAARAAVLESTSDPAAADGTKATRSKPKARLRIGFFLLLALIAAAAFAGYKYWRGELDFRGLSIGGFSLADSRPMGSDTRIAEGGEAIQGQNVLNTAIADAAITDPAMAKDGNSVALQPFAPDAAVAFAAPEPTSEPMASAEAGSANAMSAETMSGDTISTMITGDISRQSALSSTSPSQASAIPDTTAVTDTVGSTASVSSTAQDAKAGGVKTTAVKGDLTRRTEELVAAALAGTEAREAAAPQKAAPSFDLPATIGPAGLRQAAQANVPEAQYEIASRFADGSGVKSDMETAAIWYERAARSGLAPAQFRLGSLYEKGNGVPLDRIRASRLYDAAARSGNVKAMHNLAVLHAEGADGKPNLEAAAKWFRTAADHGVRDSQFNIGILYARGLGVPQNLTEAYKWFAIAARSGDAQAAKRRDTIAATMQQDEVAKALSVADIFQPVPLKPETNLVLAPSSGWAAAAAEATPSRPVLVSRIQALLADRGFDPGPSDGMMGRRTAGAIEAFQMEAGLPITGEPDLAVLSALETASR